MLTNRQCENCKIPIIQLKRYPEIAVEGFQPRKGQDESARSSPFGLQFLYIYLNNISILS